MLDFKIDWNEGPVLKRISEEMDKDASAIADEVHKNAKSTTAFKDKTGNLRGSIRKLKSKFKNGGYIVIADGSDENRGYHAHLVEFGHGGKHPAPAHPFLRPAKAKAIAKAKQITGAT